MELDEFDRGEDLVRKEVVVAFKRFFGIARIDLLVFRSQDIMRTTLDGSKSSRVGKFSYDDESTLRAF